MIDWRHFDAEGGSIAVKTVTAANAIKNANVSVGVEVYEEMLPLAVGVMILSRHWMSYNEIPAYDHFGRVDLDLPWERTNKADELKSAAGL